jgi:hypothetical protein
MSRENDNGRLFHDQIILCLSDLSDEITSITGICEYALRSVDICNFFAASIFGPWLSEITVLSPTVFPVIYDFGIMKIQDSS